MEEKHKTRAFHEKEEDKVEGLIEAILTEEEEKPSTSLSKVKDLSFVKKKILTSALFLLLLLFFTTGLWVASRLIIKGKDTSKGFPTTLEEVGVVSEKISQNATTAEKSSKRENLKISKVKIGTPKELSLELKNLFVPLDEGSFLRVDIYFYFEEYESYKQAKSKEILLREAVFQFFSDRKDLNKHSLKDTEKLQEALIQYLKKRGLKELPQTVEVEGVILRS